MVPLPIDAGRGGRSPWAVGFVSAIGGVLLAGSLMFGAGGVGDEPAQLALRPIATLAPRVQGTTAAIGTTDARGDRAYVVSIDVATSGDVRSGHGLVVRRDGHVVTAGSLVADATDIRVTLADGSILPAQVLGSDPVNDLAVLKVAATIADVAPFGTSATAAVGDEVLVVGGSRGARSPAWRTTISSVDARLSNGSCDLHGAIQLDSSLDAPAAGAAVVDHDETVIGLATATAGDTTNGPTSVAVPARTVQAVSDELIATGTVRHGWLGVEGVNASTEQATAAGTNGGAAVRRVIEASPAASAGLATDDVIVAFGGEAVGNMSTLVVVVREHQPGDVVTVEFARAGEHHEAAVVLGGPART
jgi:putative serine protease PepD